MGVIVPKLRQSARGQKCTLETDVCNHDPETTVLAHLSSDVKGMGNKSDDWHAVFACSACHELMDNHLMMFPNFTKLRALQRTQKIWRDMGLITIAGDNEKPRKPSSKILPRRPLTTGA